MKGRWFNVDLILDFIFSLPFIGFTALYSISGPLIIAIGTIILAHRRVKTEDLKLMNEQNIPPAVANFTKKIIGGIMARTWNGIVILIGVLTSIVEYQLTH